MNIREVGRTFVRSPLCSIVAVAFALIAADILAEGGHTFKRLIGEDGVQTNMTVEHIPPKYVKVTIIPHPNSAKLELGLPQALASSILALGFWGAGFHHANRRAP